MMPGSARRAGDTEKPGIGLPSVRSTDFCSPSLPPSPSLTTLATRTAPSLPAAVTLPRLETTLGNRAGRTGDGKTSCVAGDVNCHIVPLLGTWARYL